MDTIGAMLLIILGGYIIGMWLFLPAIIDKRLESIRDEIRRLGDKR